MTRSPEEALSMIEAFREQLVAGDPATLPARFAELAAVESHCSSAKRGGDLGPFQCGPARASFLLVLHWYRCISIEALCARRVCRQRRRAVTARWMRTVLPRVLMERFRVQCDSSDVMQAGTDAEGVRGWHDCSQHRRAQRPGALRLGSAPHPPHGLALHQGAMAHAWSMVASVQAHSPGSPRHCCATPIGYRGTVSAVLQPGNRGAFVAVLSIYRPSNM